MTFLDPQPWCTRGLSLVSSPVGMKWLDVQVESYWWFQLVRGFICHQRTENHKSRVGEKREVVCQIIWLVKVCLIRLRHFCRKQCILLLKSFRHLSWPLPSWLCSCPSKKHCAAYKMIAKGLPLNGISSPTSWYCKAKHSSSWDLSQDWIPCPSRASSSTASKLWLRFAWESLCSLLEHAAPLSLWRILPFVILDGSTPRRKETGKKYEVCFYHWSHGHWIWVPGSVASSPVWRQHPVRIFLNIIFLKKNLLKKIMRAQWNLLLSDWSV